MASSQERPRYEAELHLGVKEMREREGFVSEALQFLSTAADCGGAQPEDVLAPAGVRLAGAVSWDHGHPHWVH